MRTALIAVIATLTFGLGYGAALPQAHSGDVHPLWSIHMVDALNGWGVTVIREPGVNELLRTTDGGVNWTDVTPREPSAQNVELHNFDALTSIIAWAPIETFPAPRFTTTSPIFRTVDGGRTWRKVTFPGRTGPLHFRNPREGWMLANEAGYMGGNEEVDIYRSTDGGETWVRVASTSHENESNGLPVSGAKQGITFLSAATGWITGTYEFGSDWPYLYLTHDGGRTWRQQKLPLPPRMTSPFDAATEPPRFFAPQVGILPVFFSSHNSDSWAVVFYLTHDGGATWTYTTPVPVMQGWTSPWSFADVDHGWVSGGDILYTTNDSGRRWVQVAPPFADVRQLDFVSPQVGWAVKTSKIPDDGRQAPPYLVRTLDGGQTWAPVTYTILER